MKGQEAIAKTRARLQAEFEQRKSMKLEGMIRHRKVLEEKVSQLQAEITLLSNKISEVEQSSFRDPVPTEESRKRQSEASKQRRLSPDGSN